MSAGMVAFPDKLSYAQRMAERSVTPVEAELATAIAGEVRAIIARRRVSHASIYSRMQHEQSWFSRRLSGDVPWTAQELLILCNILDVNIASVYAAGTAALIEKGMWPPVPTNPCLSDSESPVVQHITEWARRGIEYALQQGAIPPQVDYSDKVA